MIDMSGLGDGIQNQISAFEDYIKMGMWNKAARDQRE